MNTMKNQQKMIIDKSDLPELIFYDSPEEAVICEMVNTKQLLNFLDADRGHKSPWSRYKKILAFRGLSSQEIDFDVKYKEKFYQSSLLRLDHLEKLKKRFLV